MRQIEFGGPSEIPPVEEMSAMAVFENHIRKIGVVAACEWFGYAPDSDFTKETIRELVKRSNVQSKWRAACGTSKRLQGAV